jgi:cell division topological specificity factor
MGRETTPSKNVAKERLRLVLVHDRSSISPQLLECLKEDMLKVISNYMDIDKRGTEVTLNSDDKTVALVANIPVIKINRLSS